MLITLCPGPVPSLEVSLFDGLNNNSLIEKLVYPHPAILYSQGVYYLDYDFPTVRVLIRISSGTIRTEFYLDTNIQDSPKASMFLSWLKDLGINFNTSGFENFNYQIWAQKIGVSVSYHRYIPTSSTIHHVKFDNYSTSQIYDDNSDLVFTYVPNEAVPTAGGPFNEPVFNVVYGKSLFSDQINVASNTGFTIGCIFASYLRFKSTYFDISVDDTQGSIILKANDGITTVTSSYPIPRGASGWASFVFTVDNSHIIAVLNGDTKNAFTLSLKDLSYKPLPVTSFELSAHSIAEFFEEEYVVGLTGLQSILTDNNPIFMGMTSAAEIILDSSIIPGNYRDYQIMVTGYYNYAGKTCQGFTRIFREQDIQLLEGSYCYIWDTNLALENNRNGITFYVAPEDMEASGFPKITNKQASVNKFGYFGAYLLWDAIYTVITNTGGYKFKLIVPRKNEERFRNVSIYQRFG